MVEKREREGIRILLFNDEARVKKNLSKPHDVCLYSRRNRVYYMNPCLGLRFKKNKVMGSSWQRQHYH